MIQLQAIQTLVPHLKTNQIRTVKVLIQIAEEFVDQSENLILVSDNQKEITIDSIKELKQIQKILAGCKKESIQPHKDLIDEIKEFYSNFMDLFELAEKGMRQKVISYEIEIQRTRLAQEKKAQIIEEREQDRLKRLASHNGEVSEAIQKASLESIQKANDKAKQLERPITQHFEHSSSTIRKVWTFEIVDLRLIPRQFFVLDNQLIKQAIRKGERDIPGVRIYQKPQLAVGN